MTDGDRYLTATVPQCDAFVNESRPSPSGWGMELVQCQQTRGLSAFVDYQGQTRRACGAQGHAANVVRRFGVMETEPEWAIRCKPYCMMRGHSERDCPGFGSAEHSVLIRLGYGI